MSTSEIQEPTPANVAELATKSARLPALALIGIFGSEATPAALIRNKDGSFQRVIVGDSIAGRQVAAIGKDRVILSRGTKTQTLTLPNT